MAARGPRRGGVVLQSALTDAELYFERRGWTAGLVYFTCASSMHTRRNEAADQLAKCAAPRRWRGRGARTRCRARSGCKTRWRILGRGETFHSNLSYFLPDERHSAQSTYTLHGRHLDMLSLYHILAHSPALAGCNERLPTRWPDALGEAAAVLAVLGTMQWS